MKTSITEQPQTKLAPGGEDKQDTKQIDLTNTIGSAPKLRRSLFRNASALSISTPLFYTGSLKMLLKSGCSDNSFTSTMRLRCFAKASTLQA
ncbi:hypothetical protein WAI453_004435 [Rhynchosporium graminicola]